MKRWVWIAFLLGITATVIQSQTTSSPRPAAIQTADAAFRAGYAALMRKDLAVAHSEFAKVVHLAPQLATGHSAFGAVLLAEGNNAAAIIELEKAHTLDPRDNNAAINLATAYSRHNSFQQSVTLFRTLETAKVQLPPDALA